MARRPCEFAATQTAQIGDYKPPLSSAATAGYKRWLKKLDHQTRDNVTKKIGEYLAVGTMNELTRKKNVEPVGDGVLEMKLQGIRIYFTIEQGVIVFLYGGTKNTLREQSRDIDHAKRFLAHYRAGQSRGRGAHER